MGVGRGSCRLGKKKIDKYKVEELKEELGIGTYGAGWERNLDMGAGVKPCCLASVWGACRIRPRLWSRAASSISNLDTGIL